MEKLIVKFIDHELGNNLWEISFDNQKHDFDECFELATKVMYLPIEEGFNKLKNDYPELTKEHYDIAAKILENGNNGVTDYRFCEFLTAAFDFACEMIEENIRFNIESGEYEQ